MGKQECDTCERLVALKKNGELYAHKCDAKAEPPGPEAAWQRPTAANVKMPVADVFSGPVVEEPKRTISGQPEAKRDRYGRYLLKDPRTGQYKTGRGGEPEGFTRATTFNKTLSDTYALSQWGKRNVMVGAAKRPDLVAQAFGKDVRADKKHLDQLVGQATEAAGDKVGANLGTALHEMTEQLDAGSLVLGEAPVAQLPELTAYMQRVHSVGMTFRREWIERTTMTSLVGEDVAGTFDRIGTLTDGSNIIVDLKTGRDPMTYGDREIAIQLLVYALGVNQFGIYDWNRDEWEQQGPQVREDLALVIHLPAQRDDGSPAFCDLYWVGLSDPDVMEAARQSAFARKWRNKKGLSRPYAPGDRIPDGPRARDWGAEFSCVTSKETAASLYNEAKTRVGFEELRRLTAIAMDRLRALGIR